MGTFDPPNIEKLKAEKNVKELIKALRDKNGNFRWKVAEALGEIGDSRAWRPLTKLLKDEDLTLMDRGIIRRAISRIQERQKDEQMRVYVKERPINALTHKNSYVRSSAVRALGQIGDAWAVEHLIKALRDSSKEVRLDAIDALGKIKDARAAKALIQEVKYGPVRWSDGSTTWVSAPIIRALVRIGKPAVEPLIDALKDEDSNVRRLAADALEKIKS